jgi:hypothetical protein
VDMEVKGVLPTPLRINASFRRLAIGDD